MKYYKRGFLNEHEGMAAFSASVDIDDSEDKQYAYVHADFTISDCNRQICLDFCIGEMKDIDSTDKKISNLIQELEEFKFKLAEATVIFKRIEDEKEVASDEQE